MGKGALLAAAALAGTLALPAQEIRLPSPPYAALGARAHAAVPDPLRDIYIAKAKEYAPGISDARAQELWYAGIPAPYTRLHAQSDRFIRSAGASGIPLEEITAVAVSMDRQYPFKEVSAYRKEGLDPRKTAELLSLTRSDGSPVFDWTSAVDYQCIEGDGPSAVRLAEEGLGPASIVETYERHLELGWFERMVEFKDTAKPNAVITLPVSDWQGIFSERGNLEFLRTFADHYDVRLRVVGRKDEAFRALNSIPEVELWMPSGHGHVEYMAFSGDEKVILQGKSEDTAFSMKTDFKGNVTTLADDAVIFMDSCLNGFQGSKGRNLANHVHAQLGRKVISSKFSLVPYDVTIHEYYPLDLTIKRRMLPFRKSRIVSALFRRAGWAYRTIDATYVPNLHD